MCWVVNGVTLVVTLQPPAAATGCGFHEASQYILQPGVWKMAQISYHVSTRKNFWICLHAAAHKVAIGGLKPLGLFQWTGVCLIVTICTKWCYGSATTGIILQCLQNIHLYQRHWMEPHHDRQSQSSQLNQKLQWHPADHVVSSRLCHLARNDMQNILLTLLFFRSKTKKPLIFYTFW